jgi:hypothetical protein
MRGIKGLLQREPAPIPDRIIPERVSEDAYIALRKLEYEHSLARLGLQGTLWGAWAILLVILAIVFTPVFSSKTIVEGSDLVWLVAALVVPVVLYGAFIFHAALTISTKIDKAGGQMDVSTGQSPPARGT